MPGPSLRLHGGTVAQAAAVVPQLAPVRPPPAVIQHCNLSTGSQAPMLCPLPQADGTRHVLATRPLAPAFLADCSRPPLQPPVVQLNLTKHVEWAAGNAAACALHQGTTTISSTQTTYFRWQTSDHHTAIIQASQAFVSPAPFSAANLQHSRTRQNSPLFNPALKPNKSPNTPIAMAPHYHS